MAVKKQSTFSKIFWRIIISAVGIALIAIAVINLLLFFLGETASLSISTRRVGGADSERPVSQRYEWSLDYTFRDENGVTRSGHTTRRGNDISVKTDSTVYYFSFAPFISTLESEAERTFTYRCNFCPCFFDRFDCIQGNLRCPVCVERKRDLMSESEKTTKESADAFRLNFFLWFV